MEGKTVYRKLLTARVMFLDMNIKPTGKNQRFIYYELEDILGPITRICDKVGLLPLMSYSPDKAVLTIFDTDNGNSLELSSPMSNAKLSGCHDVQNLGAVETYLKRYLYTHAFDIAESDILDGSVIIKPQKQTKPQMEAPAPTPAPQAEPTKAKATPEQVEKMKELAKNFTSEELQALKKDYGNDISMLIDKMTEYSTPAQEQPKKPHRWASPQVAEALSKAQPEQFPDDSEELYR